MNSLKAGGMKLKLATSLLKQQKRNFTYGFNHVINAPPLVRWPFQEKMFMGTLYVLGMISYPLWVTWKMPEWDDVDRDL